jgi:MFS family permease
MLCFLKEVSLLRFCSLKDTSSFSSFQFCLVTTLARQAHPQDHELKQPNKWIILGLVAVGVFMTNLDSSIVTISLPSIAHAFGVPLGGAIEWVMIAYLVVIAGTLLTIGRLSDMIGRRLIWVAGLVIFTLGSAMCGAAPSLPMLIASRALQGLGGSLMRAISPARLTSAFKPEERGRALGLYAVFVALGTSTGPTLGGIMTMHGSWRWIFYLNVPLGIAGMMATLFVLKERTHLLKGRFDLRGSGLLAVALVALTVGLSLGEEWGWFSPRLLVTMVVAVAAIIGLSMTEKRVTHPIIVLALLRRRVFLSANLSLMLSRDTPGEHQGSAAGFLATGRVIGQSVSVALAGAIFTSLGSAGAGAALLANHSLSPDQVSGLQHTFAHSFHVAFLVCAAGAAAGIFAGLLRGKEQRNRVKKPHLAQSRGREMVSVNDREDIQYDHAIVYDPGSSKHPGRPARTLSTHALAR